MKIKEEDIVESIRKGNDRQVIDHLYKKVFPKVKKYIQSKKGSEDDAADAFQEAIINLYHQVSQNRYNENYTPYGYLFTVSINRWLNQVRKMKRVQYLDGMEDYFSDVLTDKGFSFYDNSSDKKRMLDQFVSGLGEKCRDLIKLSIYQNMLFEDIAVRLNIVSASAAKMQLFRCKQKLLKILEDNPGLKSRLLEQ